MRVQHNIMAMSAYRNYTNNVSAMKKNLERLSSGYKINRAGDDAAGLAISEKMRAQITGLETAQKNAKDGISLVQTAEGALTEVHDMLNRMVELATQSANGTYDIDTDRYQLQKELNQLRSEIDRIADGANFNGIQLLDGSMDTAIKFSEATDVSLTPVADGQLGQDPQKGIYSIDFSNVSLTLNATGGSFSFQIFGSYVNVALTGVSAGTVLTGKDLAEKIAGAWSSFGPLADWKVAGTSGKDYGINMSAKVEGDKLVFEMDKAPSHEWTISATTFGFAGSDVTWNNAEQNTLTVVQEAVSSDIGRLYGQAKFTLGTNVELKDGMTLTIGDETYVFAIGAKSKYKNVDNVIDLTDYEETSTAATLQKMAAQRLSTVAANNKSFKVGCDLTTGTITITEKEGAVDYSEHNLAGDDSKGSIGNKGTTNATSDDWAGLVKTGMIDASKMGKGLTLQIGDTAADYNQLKVSIADCHVDAIGIGKISIATQEDAQKAVDAIRNAINYVSDVRGTLGATQNRLDHTINNLSVMTENIQDAESTIRDTDIAEEMMAYTKNNILIQASQAMLAQANQVPQGVLQLLQ